MYSKNNSVSLSLFIGAALCFLMPFVNMTCQGQKIASFTGLDLATGAKIEQPQLFEQNNLPHNTEAGKIEAQTPATLALISVIAGCVWCGIMLVLKKKTYPATAVLSILSFAFLVILNFNLDSELLAQKQVEIISLNLQAGYYLALLLLLANTLYSIYIIFQERGSIPPLTAHASSGSSIVTFCGKCGAPNSIGNSFCSKCGYKVEDILFKDENS